MQRGLAHFIFWTTLTILAALFLAPLWMVIRGGFFVSGEFTLKYLSGVFENPIYAEGLLNSLMIAVGTTLLVTLISVPLAWLANRFDFPGKKWISGLVLVPMILPPFVGAIGFQQILGQYGALNALLGLGPIDWLGRGRYFGVILLQALSLYPILYLNVAAALANIDPAMEESAANLGCPPLKRFFRITLPLTMPGLFAGGTLVFIWSFTELGTPLIMNYMRCAPVQVFDALKEIGSNPFPFALVSVMLSASVLLYAASKLLLGRKAFAMQSKAVTAASTTPVRGMKAGLVLLPFVAVIGVALLPHAGVLLTSFSEPGSWYQSILPAKYTTANYVEALGHSMTVSSIRNSLLYSSLAVVLNIVIGIAIAFVVVRSEIRGRGILDALAMLPLAVPGLVMAFGYLAISSRFSNADWVKESPFWQSVFDVRVNPTLFLVIAYTVRRLPYMVRSAAAGLQQTSVTFEESAANLGAGPFTTLRRITLPLIVANLIAGALLAFAFCMLEVSDSLMLAQRMDFYPITKTIYELFQLIGTGKYLASAMGVWAMGFLTVTIVGASLILGKKLGALFRQNLGVLAQIYFGLFSDVDHKATPIERLKTEIDDDLTIVALEGFSSIINRADMPTPTEIAATSAAGKIYPWWYAILAGMDEVWLNSNSLRGLNDSLLKAALAIDIEYSTYQHGDDDKYKTARLWKESLFSERLDIVQCVYEAIARIELKSEKEYCPVLYELSRIDKSKSWMSKLAIRLLRDFPTTKSSNLRHLLIAAAFNANLHQVLIIMANDIAANRLVKGEQRAIWLSIGFILGNKDLQDRLLKYAKSKEWVVWVVKDIIESTRIGDQDISLNLSIEQLEILVLLVGENYRNANYPTGTFSGSKNPWDAAEFVRKCISAISASPNIESSRALKRLLNKSSLKSYFDNLKHALASQAIIRRSAEYRQPTWEQVIETLSGGRPANIADLYALTCEHLNILKTEIRHSNTDIYKTFWRFKSSGAIDHPAVEDYCRDRLIDILRPRFFALKFSIEPECHMAADKRADIVILPQPGMKLPLELKRDTHKDLWNASITQLERQYMRDPDALGYGIYVVFWFGKQSGKIIPKPPSGIPYPKSVDDLENALRSLIPQDKRHCLDAVVLDVTPPALTRRQKVAKKTRNAER